MSSLLDLLHRFRHYSTDEELVVDQTPLVTNPSNDPGIPEDAIIIPVALMRSGRIGRTIYRETANAEQT